MQRLDLCVFNRIISIVILAKYLSEAENIDLQKILKDSNIQFSNERRIHNQLIAIQSSDSILFQEINHFHYINGLFLSNNDRIIESNAIYRQISKRCYSIIYYNNILGWGIETNENIEKNSLILPYYGELISTQEAIKRSKINKKHNKMNYILTMREHIQETTETKAGVLVTNIDASAMGGIARYVNHSCAPNCRVIVLREPGSVLGVPVLQSIRDIHCGEQITFDYGHSELRNTTTSSSTKLTNNGSSKNSKVEEGSNTSICGFGSRKCLCGAVECRGTLPCASD